MGNDVAAVAGESFRQRALSQDSLMRSDQGNIHVFFDCKQLILIDIMSKRRRHV